MADIVKRKKDCSNKYKQYIDKEEKIKISLSLTSEGFG